MPFADEKLIKAMNAYKAESHGTLETGIYIKEELYEFERLFLFQNTFSILLPKKFMDMPLAQAKLKYPMEQRPELIKTNEIGDVNFSFSLLNQKCKKEEVADLTDYMQQLLKNAQPANTFYVKQVKVLGNLTVGMFDFTSHGMDAQLYNMMYFVPIGDRLLHGVFNCRLADIEIWKPIALQVIQSLQDCQQKEGGEENA